MEQFPHLNFIQKISGKPRLFGFGSSNENTDFNKQNRQGHSEYLSNQTSNIRNDWSETYSNRLINNLAPLDENIIPIFLQVNPDILTSDFNLQSFGIEIISEEDEGFIIGASLDGLRTLETKINGFISEEHGTGKIADLWKIIEGKNWKAQHILSEDLYAKWNEIQDDELYRLEVSIAFDKPIGKEPDPIKQGGEARLRKYRELIVEREDRLMNRENDFERFINHYGEITSGLVSLEDSFGCEVEISGKGLKDLVFNFPFVFEVSEIEKVGGIEGNSEGEPSFEIEILPPERNSPEIGVIDSGIMEGHKYIAPAIKSANSKSYIDGDNSTADLVTGGGHGTKVCGAILYPNGITSLPSQYQLPCFIRNLRVLNGEGKLVNKFPAELMQRIVEENEDCTIFNLSINSKAPFRKKHMSSWAATIDSLIHEKNVLLIISTGNIPIVDIRHYLNNGLDYPDYLKTPFCRLANPAQSSFALTVGSINHALFEDSNWKSIGAIGTISAFSRIGTGIWGKIKPDVVELGGGLVVSKNGMNLIRENELTSPELLRSTFNEGSAYCKDSIGTSFATPKVTNIVAQLQKLYPESGANLLRALVVQGARLPNDHFFNPTKESIQHFGYGLPSIERVTKNSEYRITFYNTSKITAEEGHIYSLQIPRELRSQANEYDILIEVTLAFTAKVRRTRQKTKSYLSTWLDWTSSKFDEGTEAFINRSIKIDSDQNAEEDIEDSDEVIKWKIRERNDWGEVKDINRNNSTVQKDWTIIPAFQLPEELSFSVRAHNGWDKNKEEVPYALTVSIEVLNANVPIYESIRIENEIEIPIRV